MAQKPDLKLRVTEESVKELTELQERLLDTVSAYVKPGGTLVYSTCSILKDENEHQAERFLERHPEFEKTALPMSVPEKYRSRYSMGLQLLDHRDGLEGFYLIRMRRKDD
jgi:16S rRNA (cytosine967-C5)-methyltransferase